MEKKSEQPITNECPKCYCFMEVTSGNLSLGYRTHKCLTCGYEKKIVFMKLKK